MLHGLHAALNLHAWAARSSRIYAGRGRNACGTVLGGLEAWQGHVPQVQGVPGAFHVHVCKQSCTSVFVRSLPGPRVQYVHGPSTTVLTVLLNVFFDDLDA